MYRTNAVSVPGIKEPGVNKENQDSYFISRVGETEVISVCDGAGSARFGAIGAEFLSKSFALEINHSTLKDPSLCPTFAAELAIENFHKKIDRLISIYRLRAVREDFATTLVSLTLNKNGPSYVVHIGDGAALFFRGSANELVFASLPENGEYAHETYFVTSKGWKQKLRVKEVSSSFDDFFLMTDGVTPFALKADTVFQGFVDPLLNYLKKNENMASLKIDMTQLEGSRVPLERDPVCIRGGRLTPAYTAVEKLLSSKKSQQVSTDDKSIAWGVT